MSEPSAPPNAPATLAQVARWPGWPFAAAALAVALAAPSLTDGLQGEDWGIVLDATARAFDPWPFHAAPDPSRANVAAREAGFVPWFSDPELRIVFFRPLGTWLLQLDALVARATGLSGAAGIQLIRAHGLAWLAALIVAGGIALRRLLGPSAAFLLALAVFATDDGKALAAGWISNRPAVVSAALGLFAFVAHDRWRRDGSAVAAVAAPVLLAVAYLGGETALGAALLVVAHALVTERGWRARGRALAPAALVTLAWAAFYALAGYGARGSSVYVSPLGSPQTFLAELPVRFGASMLGLLVWPAADGWYAAAALAPAAVAVAVAVVLGAGALTVLGRAASEARSAPLWWAGGALATSATCTVVSSERVLLVPSLAAAGVLGLAGARWLADTRDPRVPRWRRLGAGAGLAWIVTVQALLTAALATVRARTFVPYESSLRAGVDTAFLGVGPEQQLFLVTVPDAGFGGLTVQLGARLRRAPPRVRVLYPGTGAAAVTRIDDRTLRLRADGGFFDSIANRMLHDVSRPLPPGHAVRLSGVTVVVEEVGQDSLPRAVLVRTDRPLDDPSHVWRRWTGDRFERFALPATGATAEVEPLAKLPFGSTRRVFGVP
ncbi:MAG: hypothetical protein IT376_15095 [Polyangiaceae bacterium]|nr:hypothetical protein [Polyangiaceae bacterium]